MSEERSASRTAFWLVADLIALLVSMGMVFVAYAAADTPLMIVAGFSMLFWQSELHRDMGEAKGRAS
jgi:hypothetical protein